MDDDLLASLARRLSLLDKRLSAAQRQEVEGLLDVPSAPERFTDLRQLSHAMLDALDPDMIHRGCVGGGWGGGWIWGGGREQGGHGDRGGGRIRNGYRNRGREAAADDLEAGVRGAVGMKFDPQKHQRRSIRLKGYDYSQPGAYFVTLCAWQRDCLFGEVVGSGGE